MIKHFRFFVFQLLEIFGKYFEIVDEHKYNGWKNFLSLLEKNLFQLTLQNWKLKRRISVSKLRANNWNKKVLASLWDWYSLCQVRFLQSHLKQFKSLGLHAILQDATRYSEEKNHTRPGHTFSLPSPIKNCYLGHVTAIAFCLFLKTFKPRLLFFVGMLIESHVIPKKVN